MSSRVLLAALMVSPAYAQWSQWGGPSRNFVSSSKGLATQWPKDGPKRLWSRPLGLGYSSIVVDGGRIFTMYRDGENEVVVALDADSGKTVWEDKYPAPLGDKIDTQFGKGPNATPLIHGGRVYTLGLTGKLRCVNAKTGKPVWSHDLMKEFGAKPPEFGFSSSPIVFGKTLITAVGGKGCGVMAFDLASGSVVWQQHDFQNIYSSPLLINVGGSQQAVLMVSDEVVGVDPANGDVLWRYPHVNQWKTNTATPVWGQDGILFVGTTGDAGSRGLKLTRNGSKTNVEEVWAMRKVKAGHGSVVRVGDYLYSVTGYQKSATVTAIHVPTGKVAWQNKEKGFSSASIVYGDGKFVVLYDTGELALVDATPEEFVVRAKVSLLKETAWAAPTLVGTRIYLRDNVTIMALDLG